MAWTLGISTISSFTVGVGTCICLSRTCTTGFSTCLVAVRAVLGEAGGVGVQAKILCAKAIVGCRSFGKMQHCTFAYDWIDGPQAFDKHSLPLKCCEKRHFGHLLDHLQPLHPGNFHLSGKQRATSSRINPQDQLDKVE